MIVTDRLTSGYKLSGADTMRRSCGKLLGHFGSNVQNPSPSLMKCIVPPDGYVFLQPDQSGAEALIVAMEAPRGKYRDLFDLDLKVHSYTALQLFIDDIAREFSVSPETYKAIEPKDLVKRPECKPLFKAIKNNERQYKLGKVVRHARSYGMGPRTLQMNALEMSEGAINLSYQEAKTFLHVDGQVFPEITQWQARIRGEGAATRTLRNLFGYPKYFGGIWNDGLERKLYAFVPQSTVGIITALAITDLWNYIRANRLPWFVLNDKHDSLLAAVPDTAEHIEHGSAVVKKFMERDLISSRGEAFRMKSGLSIGKNWCKHDPVTNPLGMCEQD